MQAKKKAPRGGAPGQRGVPGDENIACSTKASRVLATERFDLMAFAAKLFVKNSAGLHPRQGAEARRLLRFRPMVEALLEELWWDKYEAVDRASDAGLQAPVFGFERGRPLVQGLLTREGLRTWCPHCGCTEVFAVPRKVVACQQSGNEYVVIHHRPSVSLRAGADR